MRGRATQGRVCGLFARELFECGSFAYDKSHMTHLASGLDVVLIGPSTSPRLRCEGFSGLPVTNPVLIEIENDGSRAAHRMAADLRDALAAELLLLSSRSRQAVVPCGGMTSLGVCHGHNTPSCRKILLLVGSGRRRVQLRPVVQQYATGGPTYRILPVLPKGARVANVLDSSLAHLNVVFWQSAIGSIAPDVLSLAEITSNDRRVFISYRRQDCEALSTQLFDVLTQARFDVFLDRFSVEPGADFQRKLTEELANKSMVVILESRNLAKSKWTLFEINYARKHRLGVLALRLPRAPEAPGVDADERVVLKERVLDGRGQLRPAELGRVVERVRSVHEQALLRRRHYLRGAMRRALLSVGLMRHRFGRDGVLTVEDGPQGARHLHLTSRPPMLDDFHVPARQVRSPSEKGVVIAPADALGDATASNLNWLSNISRIQYFDEGRIRDVARGIRMGII
jgi:hypothetical protein